MQPYSHDLLCDNLFEMAWHDGIQYLDQSNFGNFFQKILFLESNSHPVWAKTMQPSVLWTAL